MARPARRTQSIRDCSGSIDSAQLIHSSRFSLPSLRTPGSNVCVRPPVIALTVTLTLFIPVMCHAESLYQYNFDNGTSGTWTPSQASWTICKTVTTGTPEYCQNDAT